MQCLLNNPVAVFVVVVVVIVVVVVVVVVVQHVLHRHRSVGCLPGRRQLQFGLCCERSAC